MNPGVEEDFECFLVAGIHGEIAGREIGRRECVLGNTSFEQNLDSISVSELGSVHEWGKAFTIEE